MEWQPIETAPKDGSWIMVYWDTMPLSWFPFVVFWDEGWQQVNGDMRDLGGVFPTHWMLIPEPPQ